jgi:hypothetical protein
MRRRLLLLFLLAAPGCAGAPGTRPLAPAGSDSARFEAFVASWLRTPRRDPDDDRPDREIADLETAAERRAAERALRRLEDLRAVDTARLSLDQRIDWLLLESSLRRTVQDTVLRTSQRVPGRYLTLGDLYWRVAGDRPPTPADWARVRRDLERQPRVLDLGRRQLVDPPPLWVRLAVGSARSYAAFLAGEFRRRVESGAPDSLRPGLLAAGEAARAALAGYAAFLTDTLRPAPEGSWAVGEPYYDWLLTQVHLLPYGAEGMIERGRAIHEATKRALDSLAQQLRPGARWQDLVREMQERHPEAGRVTDAYRAASRRVQALLIRDDLVRIPPCEELIFVPTPPQLRETYAWGGYGGITMRDSVAVGRFFVTDVVPGMTPAQVEEKLRTQNHGWINVIALHEGYPGHHLQLVYARRNPRPLRRQGFGNTYYGEGWALYAEHWMARAGLFADDPDGRLAQLQMRLWRTARVIIDPSIHTGRMTYEEAVRFLMDEVGLQRSAAEAEVTRFTTWPTQAPSYIIGWLELEALQAELRQALGGRFSERVFVERVLEAGPLPLALLRRAVRAAYGM